MSCYALDFDGVLCDSAAETAETAWRAGGALFDEWRNRPVPPSVVDGFRGVRPVLETGYEAIPLLRLVFLGTSRQRILDRFPSLRDAWIAKAGVSRAQLVSLFGGARDQWIATDPESWLSRHSFYPDVMEKVRAHLPNDEIHILTTKQERFVQRLLEPVCPAFPHDRIFGLDRGASKEDMLARLLDENRGKGSESAIRFVEDRLDTLERVKNRQELAPVELFLAGWGYARRQDIRRAEQDPRICVWHNPAEFMESGGVQ